MNDGGWTPVAAHPITSSLSQQRLGKGKVVSAAEAVQIIRDGDTVATG